MSATEYSLAHWVLLAGSAWGAGVLNAIAGGGSFLTLPALIAVGVPPISANATSALAVSPGYLGSTWGFRAELRQWPRQRLWREMALAASGGVAGALLLLVTPAAVFSRLVPWLLLLATVLFALGPTLVARWRREGSVALPAWHGVGLALVCVYGGYFNGGLGILLMALYTLGGETRLNTVNAFKNLHSLVLSVLSVLAFVLAGVIVWPAAALMMVCATAGGLMGARWAQRLPARAVRIAVVLIGLGMSAGFFLRTGA